MYDHLVHAILIKNSVVVGRLGNEAILSYIYVHVQYSLKVSVNRSNVLCISSHVVHHEPNMTGVKQ